MTLAEIKDLLDADIVVGEEMLNMEVSTGFAADLMSDVLAFAKEGSILLTGLTNPLVVRTAETLDLRAIIFVRGKRPSPDAVKLAKEKNIPPARNQVHSLRILRQAVLRRHERFNSEGRRSLVRLCRPSGFSSFQGADPAAVLQ